MINPEWSDSIDDDLQWGENNKWWLNTANSHLEIDKLINQHSTVKFEDIHPHKEDNKSKLLHDKRKIEKDGFTFEMKIIRKTKKNKFDKK